MERTKATGTHSATQDPDWRHHRRFNRYKLDIRVTITRENDGKESFFGRCRHLGEGGLGAVLAGELPVGNTVTLEFTLPGHKQPMRMRAAVRHRHGFLHGFEFLTLGLAQLETIRRAAKTLPPAE